MIGYQIVSVICLVFMLTILLRIIIKLIKYDRVERINYIRNFKKGQCSIIYFIAIPLYIISNLYNGSKFIDALFDSISKAIYLIALKFDTSYVSNLAAASIIYKITVLICISLVILNAMMFTISICQQGIWNEFKNIYFMFGKKERCVIIGNNNDSISIYKSCKTKKILIDSLTKDQKEKLFMNNIAYRSYKQRAFLSKGVNKLSLSLMKKIRKKENRINVIINCNDEKNNLYYCGQFVKFINENPDCVGYIEFYVFGDREYENIYSKYEDHARGSLHYINEYKQIAIDFVDKYPLTKYMNSNHIDYETATIKKDVNINVSLIGFGRTNQQLFTAMYANNQYITVDGGKEKTKKITYNFFDKLHNGNHKNLNHNYHRYEKTFFSNDTLKVNEDDYLPLPELTVKENYHYLDINDIDFYDDLNKTIDLNPNSINYIIVSLGEDFYNIDMANKITIKLKEWNTNNCYLFLRVKDKKILSDSKIFLDDNIACPFGTEEDVVYSYEKIIQEKFSKMAMLNNYVYNVEKDFDHKEVTEKENEMSRYKWYNEINTIQRESNINACLSIKNKFHLLGLDYCKKEEKGVEVTYSEYMKIYAENDMPQIKTLGENTRKIVYDIDFKKSKRQKLALQEHIRWNAFMITNGFIPATKDQILNEVIDGKFSRGKNYEMRHHGNLTTYCGLIEYRKMLAKKNNTPEKDNDVIKYDYQLLDGAYWLLSRCGYKIIKK